MTEIVTMHHNEPMTTSLAIADGVGMEHKSVIQLARNHLGRLEKFGEVTFQMRLNPQGSPTEFLWLNEQQSTFLVTLMRNSEIVLDFKEALVRAFFELRDTLRGQHLEAPSFTTTNLSHGADLAVAADRTFRSFLRASRSAGLALPQALRVANRQTIERTGMDMLAEMEIDPDEIAAVDVEKSAKTDDDSPLWIAISEWANTVSPGEFFTLRAILEKVTGKQQDEKSFQRMSVMASHMLRRCGFSNRKARYQGRLVNLWTKH